MLGTKTHGVPCQARKDRTRVYCFILPFNATLFSQCWPTRTTRQQFLNVEVAIFHMTGLTWRRSLIFNFSRFRLDVWAEFKDAVGKGCERCKGVLSREFVAMQIFQLQDISIRNRKLSSTCCEYSAVLDFVFPKFCLVPTFVRSIPAA